MCIVLWFSQYEVTNKVSCIVGRYHTALFAANPGLVAFLGVHNDSLLFVILDGLAVGVSAISTAALLIIALMVSEMSVSIVLAALLNVRIDDILVTTVA